MVADPAALSATPTRPQWLDPWLDPWLDWLDAALHREILRLRARYELSMDELRGLYVSDEQVDRLLEGAVPDAQTWARMQRLDEELARLLTGAGREPSPLLDLAVDFGLSDAETLAVTVALAPEIDLSYQSLFAYLNDDVSRRLPTIDLCARLAGGAVLEPDDQVFATGLLSAHRVESAPLWRSAGLLLADPARGFLLGALGDADPVEPPCPPYVVLLEAPDDEQAWDHAQRLPQAGGSALVRPDPAEGAAAALLAARLLRRPLFVTAADLVGAGGEVDTELCRSLATTPVRSIVALRPGQAAGLPWEAGEVERVSLEGPNPSVRAGWWRQALTEAGASASVADVEAVASLFTLGPAAVRAAARSAAHAGATDAAGLSRAAREVGSAPLAGVAQRITSAAGWDDLVLPRATLRRLEELRAAVRHRVRIFEDWDFGRLGGGQASVRALFSGPSGTGKTMAASVLAGELGLDLYRVDLSSVVSKYVGETEKNLERILTAAEDSDAVLLFDEADALFGKRTEVKDAHDRYANIETAFLLQRLDTFDGVVLLATNLAANLDEAFSRRIQFHVEFPMPDEPARVALWRTAIPAQAPVGDDLDPGFLAAMFPMSGGDVRSAAVMAAFLAAAEDAPIGMAHVVRALARQRRQQGKVPSASEFRQYLRVALEDGADARPPA